MKYFDAFAGIGGFAFALSEWEHTCIGFSEIDLFATRVYRRHFPSHRSYGDITKIAAKSLPNFDLLVAGFPCQAFSLAGKRFGFADVRGALFFELERILRAKRPQRFVFENVKGLLSHDAGRTFKAVVAAIDELGYHVEWQVLNSRHFGVAQNRERLFLVGHSRTTSRAEVFPFQESDIGPPAKNRLSRRKTVVSVAIRGRREGACLEARNDNVASALRTGSGGSSKALIGHLGHRVNDGLIRNVVSIRRLTPVECERLQGFPDGWTEFGIDETGQQTVMSDTQRYKCLGNAVTVSVARAIVDRLTRWDVRDTNSSA